ncbi:MAG: cation transport regulator ChaB [Chloroflexi bacterium]|nr:cation transport regulator ChaB [Chloroflexota bacterium]
MPTSKNPGRDLPSTIERSDQHAQEIFTETLESAEQTYGEGSRAYRVAYAALKHQYEKRGDRWVTKGWKGPSDPQARRGATTRRSSMEDPPAPTARGKVAGSEQEAREKAETAGREYAIERRKRLRRAS